MNNVEEMVREFQRKFGHYEASRVSHPPKEVRDLRVGLITEEIDEMLEGLYQGNLEEIADGAADAVYVIVGACIAYGIPFNRIFQEVHRSNMTKTAIKAEDGQKYGTKTPKGPDYIPPDIRGILSRPDELTRLEKIYANASETVS